MLLAQYLCELVGCPGLLRLDSRRVDPVLVLIHMVQRLGIEHYAWFEIAAERRIRA